jgi:hypothetical protein
VNRDAMLGRPTQELLNAAAGALVRMEQRRGEDIDQWAAELAESMAGAGDDSDFWGCRLRAYPLGWPFHDDVDESAR